MDVLGTLKEEQVHIYLNDASSPALIKTLENPRDSFVIMPVKV
jgi:DNA polymerase-3 subunit beta